MKKPVLCILGLALMGASGCAMVASPLPGAIYTDVKYPGYYHGVDNAGPGPRRGQAQATSILGIVATGDASVEAAARAGGIKTIHTADTHVTNLLGLFATYTTTVTGE